MYIDLPKDRIGNIHDNQKYEREKERLRGDRCGYEIPKTGSVEDVTKRLIASQILSKQEHNRNLHFSQASRCSGRSGQPLSHPV